DRLEPAIFEERQDLQQFPSTPHERPHQRKLSDENVPYIDLSLPTTCNSTIYQPTRGSHRTHTLLPRRLTDVVEDHVYLPAISDPFDFGWNILGMMVHDPVGSKLPSFFELLIVSRGGYDLRA